ncbi:hypothetical protein [Neorhizobium sp. AL 9.2.2]|uniref:hypothetical protein n=1 Tax=Neorhizobium sp. AL 9.2.2 TaxID=2712894 RepID=UPI0015725348|nr:hypothetical protein [Neorhizobium sp. AL 9.2.2]NSY20093.1 hypothetical protein [Neorhizobium sp. AL 9.2.2]
MPNMVCGHEENFYSRHLQGVPAHNCAVGGERGIRKANRNSDKRRAVRIMEILRDMAVLIEMGIVFGLFAAVAVSS